MEFLSEVGLFLAQAVSVVLALLLLVLGIAVIAQRQKKSGSDGHMEVRKLHERYRHHADTLAEALDPEGAKAAAKAREKAEKAAAKARSKARSKAHKRAQKEARKAKRESGVADIDGVLQHELHALEMAMEGCGHEWSGAVHVRRIYFRA